ncbi:hypothetical protein OS493_025016 [Desmophyllum pertusum]|uniref:Uncharacterized protein n=1 Tax=Desmophyllum pertusum TaxID=174260 RepID=A0A9X0CJI9_9CNID|nr:hypothetical protein OS493_025016 [Desmophyllum pertusum]
MKEMIIYLPPSQDDFDSEVASSNNRPSRGHFKYIAIFKRSPKADAPRVHEILRHYEALQLTHHQSCPDIAQQVSKGLQDHLDEQEEPVKLVNDPVTPVPLNRSPSLDFLPSRLQTFLRAQVEEKERKSPSSEDDEDEVISPSEDVTKPFGEYENKSEGGEDEEIVCRYFETLGTSTPGQKIDEQVTEPPPLDTDRLMRTRLSISARFLSRSHQPGRICAMSANIDEEKGDSLYSSDDSKQDLQRRKEEMAQAVEATRKRLEALGWKAKEDILKKIPTSTVTANTNTAASTVITSVSSTTSTAVTAAAAAAKTNTVAISISSKATILTPSVSSAPTTAVTAASKTNTFATSTAVSSTPTAAVMASPKAHTLATFVSSTPTAAVTATSKTNTVSTSVSFTPTTTVTATSSAGTNGDSTPTRLAEIQEKDKQGGKEHSEKKEIPGSKKENDSKEEDAEKSKRASHLIAFFSGQSKSSKNKDKEKDNTKEKTKTKEKDKEKGRSTPPRGSRHPTLNLPQGRICQRRILSQDQQKHGESSLKSVKEDKEKKSTKPQPERRSSAELAAAKNSQSRVKANETAASSSKNAPLREKKSRVTNDERREKSRSLGDIDKRLHTVEEVSILDLSVPPSRTVDTMDIPDQVKEKRPRSSAGLLETTPNAPLERKAPGDINGVLAGINTFKDRGSVSNGTSGDSLKNTSLVTTAANNENTTEQKPTWDKKPAPALGRAW